VDKDLLEYWQSSTGPENLTGKDFYTVWNGRIDADFYHLPTEFLELLEHGNFIGKSPAELFSSEFAEAITDVA